MPNRKLGKASDHRNAMLRNLTTALLWNGKIVTTEARAKEIRPIAEKLITLAVSEYKNTVTVEKETRNEKQQIVKVEKTNDMPSKLHARRQMMAYLYNTPCPRRTRRARASMPSAPSRLLTPWLRSCSAKSRPSTMDARAATPASTSWDPVAVTLPRWQLSSLFDKVS